MKTTMTTVEARAHLAEQVNRMLEEIEEQIDIRDAVTALKEAEIHGTISLEEFKIAQRYDR